MWYRFCHVLLFWSFFFIDTYYIKYNTTSLYFYVKTLSSLILDFQYPNSHIFDAQVYFSFFYKKNVYVQTSDMHRLKEKERQTNKYNLKYSEIRIIIQFPKRCHKGWNEVQWCRMPLFISGMKNISFIRTIYL